MNREFGTVKDVQLPGDGHSWALAPRVASDHEGSFDPEVDGTPTSQAPSSGEAWRIVPWRGGRLRLTMPLPPGDAVQLGSIGTHSLELTTVRGAPGLGVRVTVQSRNRIAIAARGSMKRFASAPDELVVLRQVWRGTEHLIQVARLGLLQDAMDGAMRHAPTYAAKGWVAWRNGWLTPPRPPSQQELP